MFNKKLISVRIDEDVLNVIDQWAGSTRYYRRSDVINHLLRKSVDAVLLNDGKLANTHRNLFNVKLVLEDE